MAVFTKPTKKYDLNTSDGLYQLAVDKGLKDDADRVLSGQKGEKPKKIFSGGFISDIFDVLNALQYGVTGVLKGKGFVNGVKNRESFADQDALGDKGLPGLIGGIALDIAVDPLTYIAPLTVLKKIPGLAKVAKAGKEAAFGRPVLKVIDEGKKLSPILKKYEPIIQDVAKFEKVDDFIASAPDLIKAKNLPQASAQELKNLFNTTKKEVKVARELEGGTKVGRYVADKFVYMFGADSVFREIWERGVRNIGKGINNIIEIPRGIQNLSDDVASKLLTKDTAGRLVRVPTADLLGKVSPEEFKVIKQANDTIDQLGRELVDTGVLTREKFEENLGEYIQNNYQKYVEGKSIFGTRKAGIRGTKKRRANLTQERMQELGQIENPAFLYMKSIVDMKRDVETAKMFNEIAGKFSTTVAQDGFKKLPEARRLGALSGKYVPDQVYNMVQDINDPINFDKISNKLIAAFKFNKVILNPATHARNIMSNMTLNWWKLSIGPWRLDLYGEALKEVAKGDGKWIRLAKQAGYDTDTFAAQELRGLLDSPEAARALDKFGSTWKKAKNKLADIYQAEENIAKLTAFIHHSKKGFSPEEAWKAAEAATFNYAQITPFIRKLRHSLFGLPFITFTVKSTPTAIETALKHPKRISVFGKIKQGIEQQADIEMTERERASEPPWVRDGFYIKLPIQDKYGRSAYFDMTYIIPFGDIVSGNFFQRGVDRESGATESLPETAIQKSPVLNFIKEVSKNQDFYGDKIWQDTASTDKQMADLMRHLSKTLLPPMIADQIPGGYKQNGERRQKGIAGALDAEKGDINQQRTLMQEMLRNVGAKIQPVDVDIQESLSEFSKKRALQSLLLEMTPDELREFRTIYQPKKK